MIQFHETLLPLRRTPRRGNGPPPMLNFSMLNVLISRRFVSGGIMAASNGPLRGEYTFLPQERVIFGVGSLAQLPEEIARIGAVRALIVTGATLASETDVIVSVAQALGSLHAGTFAGVRQHTPGSAVA